MKARRRATWAAVAVLAAVVVAGLAFVSQAPAVSTPVVISSGRPEAPSISGTLVAWADKRSGNWDVYTRDGANGRTTRVTSDGADQAMPSLGGGMLAYVDFSTNQGDIVLKDLATSAVSRLEIVGPQMNPVVTDGWLTYEDRSNPYGLVVIRALDGSYYNEFGASNYSASRPMVAGNLLVYENRDASGSAGDADVKALDLVTKTEFLIASSSAQELFPATDGRHIAWAQGTESGSFKIRLYDRQTGIYTDLSGDVGEQTRPFIAGGVVYWIDNVTGQPLHVDTYEIATGKTSPYYTYSTGDVIALAASGRNTAWLENVGNRSRVRAVFSDGTGPLAGLAAFKPLIASGTFRPLSVVAGADGIAPAVTSTSVEPGQRNVSKTAALTVSFSEGLSAETVDSSSFKLVEAGTGDIVASSVSYSALTKTVTVTPVDPLGNGAYTLVVEPTVADTAGNRLGTTTEVSFGTLGAAADIYPPSTPWIQYARPSGLSNVEIAWDPATDDGGPIKEYRVYRSLTPIVFADLIPGNLVAVVNGSTTSVTTATAATDSLKSYTYYYAVAAVDSMDRLSDPPSTNVAPNPHGTFGTSSRRGVRSCTRCHDVHGGMAGTPDLQANSAEQCYACHGATPGNNLYGFASTMDSRGQFNDDNGIATGGTEGIGNDNWRIHRTSYLYAGSGATVNYQCMACHTAHRKAYDDDPTKSFGRLLRMYPNGLTGASRYSTDTAPFNESLCYQCHGATSLTLMQALSPGAYSNTGGDHQTEYSAGGANAVAHGAAIIMKNRPPLTRANGGTLPNIACTACHNEHASPNQGMTDYRQSNTTQTTFNQAGLCFECHTKGTGSDGQNEVISSGTVSTGFTWNSRDVKAEFQRASRHPTSVGVVAPGSGRWQPATGTVFTQTTDLEFGSDALTQTVTSGAGSVQLGTYTNTPVIDPPSAAYLFSYVGGGTIFDQYLPADNAWNANNSGRFNPTDGTITTASGSQLFTAAGKVYVTQAAAGANQISAYTPPANSGNGTWANINIQFNSSFGAGSQATTANAASSVVYLTAGGGSSNINWFRYDNNTENNMVFHDGTNPMLLGAGSGAAYAPGADRLFVIRRNGTTTTGTGVGNLWYRATPGVLTGNQTFTNSTRAVTRATANTDYNRLVYFRDGAGVEYLMMVGLDTAGAGDTVIVPNLTNATLAAPTNLNISPFTLTDGSDLKWDGVDGGYIYVTRGGANATISRIRIPAANAQTAGNWTTGWTALTAMPQNAGAGAGISFALADPPSYSGTPQTLLFTDGWVTTPDISPVASSVAWGTLAWNGTTPANTTLSVTVRYSTNNFATWTDLTGVANGADLAALGVPAAAKIRLIGNLGTTDPSNLAATPNLNDWTVTGMIEVWQPAGASSSGAVTCVNCHNAHEIKVGGASAWSLARVSDPANIHGPAPADYSTFCLRCHQSTSGVGFPGTAGRTASSIVPYAVSFTAMPSATYPFFPGWDKASGTTGFTNSAHYTATAANGKAECSACHDPHGSDFARLTAWSRPVGAVIAGGVSRSRVNTDAAVSREENLCFQCHGDGTATRGKSAGAPNIYSAITATYGHPTSSVSGRHTDTETPSTLGAAEHAECVDCHNPHAAQTSRHAVGTNVVSGTLLGVSGVVPVYTAGSNWVAPTSFDATSAAATESQICFKCHSRSNTGLASWGGSGAAAWSDVSLDFNPNNGSYHPVVAALPVTDPSTAYGSSRLRNQNQLRASWSLNGWTSGGFVLGQTMYCSDCHASGNAASFGPHGSSVKWMLRGPNQAWPYTTRANNGTSGTTGFLTLPVGADGPDGNFCANCHTFTNIGNTHTTTDKHGGASRGCVMCHVRVPHGSKGSRLIAVYGSNTGYPGTMPARLTPTGIGTTPMPYITGFRKTTGNPAEGDCTTNSCGTHSTTPLAASDARW